MPSGAGNPFQQSDIHGTSYGQDEAGNRIGTNTWANEADRLHGQGSAAYQNPAPVAQYNNGDAFGAGQARAGQVDALTMLRQRAAGIHTANDDTMNAANAQAVATQRSILAGGRGNAALASGPQQATAVASRMNTDNTNNMAQVDARDTAQAQGELSNAYEQMRQGDQSLQGAYDNRSNFNSNMVLRQRGLNDAGQMGYEHMGLGANEAGLGYEEGLATAGDNNWAQNANAHEQSNTVNQGQIIQYGGAAANAGGAIGGAIASQPSQGYDYSDPSNTDINRRNPYSNSDVRVKKDINSYAAQVLASSKMLDGVGGTKSWKYQPGFENPGEMPGHKNYGPMVQDLEKSEMGSAMKAPDGPGGVKRLDVAKVASGTLSALADVHQRVKALEGGHTANSDERIKRDIRTEDSAITAYAKDVAKEQEAARKAAEDKSRTQAAQIAALSKIPQEILPHKPREIAKNPQGALGGGVGAADAGTTPQPPAGLDSGTRSSVETARALATASPLSAAAGTVTQSFAGMQPHEQRATLDGALTIGNPLMIAGPTARAAGQAAGQALRPAPMQMVPNARPMAPMPASAPHEGLGTEAHLLRPRGPAQYAADVRKRVDELQTLSREASSGAVPGVSPAAGNLFGAPGVNSLGEPVDNWRQGPPKAAPGPMVPGGYNSAGDKLPDRPADPHPLFQFRDPTPPPGREPVEVSRGDENAVTEAPAKKPEEVLIGAPAKTDAKAEPEAPAQERPEFAKFGPEYTNVAAKLHDIAGPEAGKRMDERDQEALVHAYAIHSKEKAQADTDVGTANTMLDDAAKQAAEGTLRQEGADMEGHIAENQRHDYEQDAKHLADYHEDPDHFWNSRSTAQKVAGFIGIALGGFAQGLRGGTNAALDQINGAIGRDIDAQRATFKAKKDSVEAKKSAYGMAMEKYDHDDAKATAVLKMAGLAKASAMAEKTAAQHRGTQADVELEKVLQGFKDRSTKEFVELHKYEEAHAVKTGGGLSQADMDKAWGKDLELQREGKAPTMSRDEFYSSRFGGIKPQGTSTWKTDAEAANKGGDTAKDQRDRTVIVKGEKKLAINGDAAKDYRQYQEAAPVLSWHLKEMQDALRDDDPAKYDTNRLAFIEHAPKAYHFNRGPSEAQAGGIHGTDNATIAGQLPHFTSAKRFAARVATGGAAFSDSGLPNRADIQLSAVEKQLQQLDKQAHDATFEPTPEEKTYVPGSGKAVK